MTLILGCVGIDRHSDPQIRDLTGARRDATALWALVTDTISEAAASRLVDEEATLSAIRELLVGTLDGAGPDDVVLLSFAGHGTHDHRLVACDTRMDELAETTLPMAELAERFRASRARAVICLLDCCFSGGAPARVLENSPIPRDPAAPFTIEGNGRILLAACNVDEAALEDPITRHGLFTHALLECLQQGAEPISLVGLVDQVNRRVRADAARLGYVQTPVMFGHVEGEISIPVLRRGVRYAAAFPESTHVRVSTNFGDLAAYGIASPILDQWSTRFPAGVNELQLTAINDHNVLGGSSLLCVAPTSAGKTFIGELAAMRVAQRGEKTVFLLPYRALVNEKYDEFLELYGERLGLRIARCSGDWQDQVPTILRGKYDIAFFTYETFLGLALNSPHMLSQIGLVVLDEAQFIADPGRGITVELLLTHLVSARDRGIRPQLICLSAVIGGTNALDEWLGCRLLLTTQRPVPLTEGVVDRAGVLQLLDSNGDVQSMQLLPAGTIQIRRTEPSSQDVIVPLVRQLVGNGEKVLIFRNQRGLVQGCAAYLATELGLPPAQAVINALPDLDQSSRSRELRQCLQGGTSFHSTDLRREERRAIEIAFRDPDGPVRVLVATSTVAAGINTPASTVIIVETEFVGAGVRTPYTVAQYKNMAGRAGRLGFREEGKSILVAETGIERMRLFRTYVQGTPEQIVSSFDGRSPDTWIIRLLAQVQSVARADVVSLLANTYGGYLAGRADVGWRGRIEPQINRLLDRMLQNGLLELDGERVRLTILGRACGQSPLQLSSALQLVEMLRLFPPADMRPSSVMALVQGLPKSDADYTPMARGPRGEPSRQTEAAQRFGDRIASALQRRAADARAYHARCKRALILADWIDGVSIDEIEQRYTPNPFSRLAHGDIVGFVDQTNFFLQSAFQISAIVFDGQGPTEEAITSFLRQLEIGIPEEALPLLSLPMVLTRGEYLTVFDTGARCVDDVRALPLDELVAAIGQRRATDLHARL